MAPLKTPTKREKPDTRIDPAGPGRWRWCLVNPHDRMLVHFFGTAPECRAIDAAWLSGERPPGWRTVSGSRGKSADVGDLKTSEGVLVVVRTRASLTLTPCVDCHGSKAVSATPGAHDFPC